MTQKQLKLSDIETIKKEEPEKHFEYTRFCMSFNKEKDEIILLEKVKFDKQNDIYKFITSNSKLTEVVGSYT